MRTVNIFGTEVEIREHDCQLYNFGIRDFGERRANLFIQLTNKCNANCKFCEYHGCDKNDFNINKLKEVIAELDTKINFGKVNITGGEPLIDMPKFEKVIEAVSNIKNSKPEVVVNTNGINLEQLINYQDKIDSIGLSRHHFDDKLNTEIFGCTNVPTLIDIEKFQSAVKNKFLLHSRCNLIKEYIDSKEKIAEYLDKMAEVGIVWAGFVTLMPLNQYCIDNAVCANSLIDNSKEFARNQLWHRYEDNKVECQCADYIYCTPSGKMIFFYNRIFCNPNLNAGQLVFDGQNLRQGFSGEIII